MTTAEEQLAIVQAHGRTPTRNELDDVERRFTYHPPLPGQPERYALLREETKQLASLVLLCCPPSPERSVALRKLDEFIMSANASIARNEG